MTEYNGVERSITEHLRQLLDERGVKWEALSDQQEGEFTITATRWHDCEGGLLTMCINETHGSTWDFFWLPTPEQAVAATLGRGTCKDIAETRKFSDKTRFECSECGYEYSAVGGFGCDYGDAPDFDYCPNCGRRVVE